MTQSNQYIGLDVSLKETSICVIDRADKIVWRGQVDSTPELPSRSRADCTIDTPGLVFGSDRECCRRIAAESFRDAAKRGTRNP